MSVILALLLLASAASAGSGGATVRIPFDPDDLQFVESGGLSGIFLPGAGLVESEGLPRLPVLPVRIALPTGTRATAIEVVEAVYTPVQGLRMIAPAGPLHPLSMTDGIAPALPDPHVYGLEEPWPLEMCELSSSGALWGIPVAWAEVHPVRWNPSTREVSVLRHLVVSVEWEDDPSVRLISRRAVSSEEQAMSLVSRLVVNPGGVSPSGAVLVSERDLAYGRYVIITHPDYEAAAQELADWKTAKGVPANVYTTTWVQAQYACYDLQQEMRAFLADCRDEGADYVLIVGDDDRVAARDAYLSAYGETAYAPSDLYFADNNDTAPGADNWDSNGNHIWGEAADNVDWHPDLWVGRASVNTAAEAALFVDKVLLYEDVPGALDYFETAPREMRVGYSTGVLWYSPYYSGAASAEIISGYVPTTVWEEEKCYEESGNSGAITTAMINAGPHHVYHASHGSQTYMYTSYGSNYGVTEIMGQTNIASGHLPAIWNSIACYIGQIDGYECCGDAWNNSPGGGGFGAFNSRYGWGHYGAAGYGPSERICERFYYEHWQNDIHPLGQAHLVSMDHFAPPEAHSDSFEVDVLDWCLKEYNLLGDPEIDMWTAAALPLSVGHPTSIGGTGAVTVTVSDSRAPVQGAMVCMQKGDWQTGEVYVTGITDASGQAQLYVTPASTGPMTVTVTAHDHTPYQGTIQVTSVGVGGSSGPVLVDRMDPVTPSPASSQATVGFTLSCPGMTRVEVRDLAGRLVAVPMEGDLPAGRAEAVWDLRDSGGAGVPSGVYVVVVISGDFRDSRDLVVLH